MRNTFFVFFSFSLYGTEPPGCKFFSEAVSGKGETGASQEQLLGAPAPQFSFPQLLSQRSESCRVSSDAGNKTQLPELRAWI